MLTSISFWAVDNRVNCFSKPSTSIGGIGSVSISVNR